MDRDELWAALQELRRSRSEAGQLVLAAVVLGFLVGALVTMVFAWLWGENPAPHLGTWIIATLAVITLLSLWAVHRLYTGQRLRPKDIAIILPLRLAADKVSVDLVPGYAPTVVARGALAEACSKEPETGTRFLEDWREARAEGRDPFLGYVREVLQHLIEFLLLQALGEVGEMTLTQAGQYTGQAVDFPAYRLKMEDYPTGLASNYFLQRASKTTKKGLWLPEGAVLKCLPCQEPGPRGVPFRDIRITCARGGTILLKPSPYWARVPAESKPGRIMSRAIPPPTRRSEVWLVAFRVGLVPTPGGLSSLLFPCEEFYLWRAQLLNWFERTLDWHHMEQADTERMIMQIKDQVDALTRALSPPKTGT